MIVYLILLVASVFLGTELLAVTTPIGQLTLYRLLVFVGLGLTLCAIWIHHSRLSIQRQSVATFGLAVYCFWWCYAFVTVLWAISLSHWGQAMFLLTLGIGSIILLYLWIDSLKTWKYLLISVWIAMSGLIAWGYFEIITNRYLFADLDKLDKYHTFVSQPLSRIPVTIFENQNDYGTMLIAYLAVVLSLYHLTKNTWSKLMYLACLVLAGYLMYRTRSRMALLGFAMYLVIYMLTFVRIDLTKKQWRRLIISGIVGIALLLIVFPSVYTRLSSLVYLGGSGYLSGDTVRVNLMRNGLIFLGQTFGFGVGAGNIEVWMQELAFLPTETIVNMHNWWFEILVSYGWLVFALYVAMYLLLIVTFYRRMHGNDRWALVCRSWFTFLLVFIFASVTSANNLLIEWHWLIFGLMLSLIKLLEVRKEVANEFTYAHR